MVLRATPKFKRNLSRIIPFGIIWLITGWVFLLSDIAATGNQVFVPDSAITITIPIFIFSSIAVVIVGLLVGTIEMVFLEKRLRHLSLTRKILYKLSIYLAFLFVIMVLTYPVAASIELKTSPFTDEVWAKTTTFFTSITFYSTILQLSFSLFLSLFYSAISENVGHQVLLNFFTGKYHKPKVEQRIFMFLDMKSSTSIAEQLGHVAYFDLLQQYYDMMSDPIIQHYGEVYQYIGDEIVVSWPLQLGIQQHNCIRCFYAIKQNMRSWESQFQDQFGVFPDFRAGMHIGEVTTGEIGALKKEIVFTGDVLNTTARIQGLCKAYKTDLVVSEDLIQHLTLGKEFKQTSLGSTDLRGKAEKVNLYTVGIHT